jgi:hypothetical protein
VILVVVILVVVVHSGGGPAAGRWSADPLTGALDTKHWSPQLTRGVTLAPGKGIGITLTPDGAPGVEEAGKLVTTCQLAGDYDAQVSYTLDVWPPLGLGRVGILGDIDSSRVSLPTGEVYAVDPNTQTGPVTTIPLVGVTPTTDTEGQLRLVRRGTTYTGFHRHALGDAWTEMGTAQGSAQPMALTLKVWSDQPGVPREASFTDFRIVSGTCS